MNRFLRTRLHLIPGGLFAAVLLLVGCGGGGGGGGGGNGGGGTTGTSSSTTAIAPSSATSSLASSSASPLETIKAALDGNPPSMTAPNEQRSKAIQDFDNILWATDETQATPPEIINYYKSRIAKIATEIQWPVQSGFRVWNLYNHGFIVKTKTTTFAFDLVEGKNGWTGVELPPAILDQISALFISHEHGDHYDETERIPSYIKSHGGAVIYPKLAAAKNNTTLLVDGYETIQIKDLTINTYTGEHNAPVLIYEVITADGYKIVHTGDNQDSRFLPELDNIHVLLLNGWVNESGNAAAINLDGMKNSLSWMKPDVMIPGHFEELAHHRFDRTGRYRYTEGITLQNDITQKSKTVVLTWGEKLDYTGSVCAPPLVKIYSECSAPLPKSTVEFKIKIAEQFPFENGYLPAGFAEDDKSVWVSINERDKPAQFIYRFDKGNGKLLGNIPAPSKWARNLAFDGTDLWLTDYIDTANIFRLSRTTGEILTALPLDSYPLYYQPVGLAVVGDDLYLAMTTINPNVGDSGSKIYKINKNTGVSSGAIFETSDITITGLAYANSSLWFTSHHEAPTTLTGYVSRLTNISLSGEIVSAKNISINSTTSLTPGVNYLLYLDGSLLGKVFIP